MVDSSTLITFSGGSVSGDSTVLLVEPVKTDSSKCMIFVKETPFHPINHRWPDQPGDKGLIEIQNQKINVEQCLTASFNCETHEILIDKEITAKRDDPNYFFLVAHIINIDPIKSFDSLLGQVIHLEVDKKYRQHLSEAHTAIHLSALALNKITNDYWKNPIGKDALSNFDLDKAAILWSKIEERMSYDCFRLGKSIRKKGFEVQRFFDEIKVVEEKVNQELKNWISFEPKISISPKVALLHESIEWSCELPDGVANIFCGGTHISQIPHDAKITINLIKDPELPEFTMETKYDNLD